MARRRTPTAEELSLWARAITGATPLPGREPPSVPAAPSTNGGGAVPAPSAPAPRRTPRAAAPRTTLVPLDPSRPIDLDRRSWLRLKRGRQPIDARLDLHGLTQEEAHRRLDRFLADSQRRGHRCVLVITGRGLVRGGVLRRMVPRWLGEAPNRGRVLTYSPARVQHGGEGALYLLLRRPSG